MGQGLRRGTGQAPTRWPERWDLTRWRFVGAFVGTNRVGGAAVVIDAADADGPAAGADVAVLRDIRGHAEYRRRGAGRQLLEAAEERARFCGRRRMTAETQHANVVACRFSAGPGCRLTAIDTRAYPTLPAEARLMWQEDL